ncbi:hypothetical protein [Plasmodium yoelii yoelii]|uniref:Uncharacterized protein n=1 Tax=Plasmodium yoelii yoelii TaxID=73239 RepID=Q7RQN9_PLAYO|nr:hypothetical protein [Plasmodium yoelii yoelii]
MIILFCFFFLCDVYRGIILFYRYFIILSTIHFMMFFQKKFGFIC